VGSTVPTGTVTMLFSDMEESTRLLTGLGAETYREILAVQRRLQREAYARWRGHEMGTEGDSFFVVFESARDAVNACVQAQRSLTGYEWPHGAQVKVRMGVHTGEPTPHEDGYVGLDVHVAARVAATAHGGQVVVSEATCRLVSPQLGDGTELRSLGAHRLKDIAELQHLHQLVAPGLRETFPPPRSLGTATNLPPPTYPLIRRERELAEVTALVTRPEQRLHTLIGAGGAGKTRLAIEVADKVAPRFPDGVFFVPLAAVSEAAVMWSTIAEVLGLTGQSKSPPTFFESIRDRRLLLVLDNLEQLGDAGSQVVAELLSSAPRAAVLATSRRPLHLPGEQEYCVDTLPVPAAVDMFAQMARLVRPEFAVRDDNAAAIAEVCRRLDGLPLALELAAARTKFLSPDALLARLDRVWEPTTSGVHRPDRHQTLRATVAWSHDLLSPELQVTFRRLGVFTGGAELDALAVVTGAADGLDALTQLVDASLAKVEDQLQGPRVHLLETVRRFALEQLESSGELDAVRRRHAEHYLAMAEAAAKELRGPGMMSARATLEADIANVRAALVWSLGEAPVSEDPDRTAIGLRLCSALSFFWYTSGYVAEGREWARRASAVASADQGPELAHALHTLGILLMQQGDYRSGRDVLAKSLRLWQRIGDRSRVAMELNSLSIAYRNLGDVDRARQLLAESATTAREIGDSQRLATALGNLGLFELDRGDAERAHDLLLQAEAVDRERGDSWGVVVDQTNRVAALVAGKREREGLTLLRSLGPEAISLGDQDLTVGVIEMFAVCCAVTGDARRAARMFGAAEAMREQAQLPRSDPDAAFIERYLAPARQALDDTEWAKEEESGRGYTAAEALADGQAAG